MGNRNARDGDEHAGSAGELRVVIDPHDGVPTAAGASADQRQSELEAEIKQEARFFERRHLEQPQAQTARVVAEQAWEIAELQAIKCSLQREVEREQGRLEELKLIRRRCRVEEEIAAPRRVRDTTPAAPAPAPSPRVEHRSPPKVHFVRMARASYERLRLAADGEHRPLELRPRGGNRQRDAVQGDRGRPGSAPVRIVINNWFRCP
ncbi:uncharacterized protein A1O5_12544 [Cladophialophora psammophila CBS 110553]|uniref:Uncharacterized protein n=1 Tax=Cladophialophora psammophila CBS 110553 TaxID=1182543 RepID=W9VKR9_9EURO|nr:uncharacterized protein A1O5_12544 [Cladophialophora psammophila CBS 110553]EXJ56277.1 hypothetical protein A1O5_12544 [Cladophialophora psammophila CBS 110553]